MNYMDSFEWLLCPVRADNTQIENAVIGFFIERYDNCFLGGNVVSLCFVRPPNLPKKAQAQDKYILLYNAKFVVI